MDNAITLAVLISGGFYMAYKKLPPKLQKWIRKHGLLVDLMCMVLTYWTLGGTVTALLAGAMVDIIISAMLHVANHPEDFVWLFDIFARVKKAFRTVEEKLKEMNEQYKARHNEASTESQNSLGDRDPLFT